MSKITYTDKVTLNENPNVADVNKVKADDLNEIKNVVNANDDAINEINNKLVDTGWINLTITNNNWENFPWEPLAYRRIGEVCYINGGGTLSNISSLSSKIICNLPYRPRQNFMLPQGINNSGQTATIFVSYSKTLEFMGTSDNRNDAEILINISYPISY